MKSVGFSHTFRVSQTKTVKVSVHIPEEVLLGKPFNTKGFSKKDVKGSEVISEAVRDDVYIITDGMWAVRRIVNVEGVEVDFLIDFLAKRSGSLRFKAHKVCFFMNQQLEYMESYSRISSFARSTYYKGAKVFEKDGHKVKIFDISEHMECHDKKSFEKAKERVREIDLSLKSELNDSQFAKYFGIA